MYSILPIMPENSSEIMELVQGRILSEGLLASFYWPYEILQSELREARGFLIFANSGDHGVFENRPPGPPSDAKESSAKQPGIVGFVLFRDRSTDWEISCLMMSLAFERKGYMRALLRHLLNFRIEQQVLQGKEIRVFLEVHCENTSAQKLYESVGFLRVGERKAYYRDGRSAFVYLA